MTFTPIDAAACFLFAALFVGVVAALMMRMKFDWLVWAGLTAASLPPAIYASLRLGADFETTVTVVVGVACAWAAYCFLSWGNAKLRIAGWRWMGRLSNRGRAVFSGQAQVTAPPATRPALVAATSPPVTRPALGATTSPLARRPTPPAAMALIGFGGAIAAASGMVFFFLFLPSRHGPARLPIRLDHPAFLISAGGLAIGLLMCAAGGWALDHVDRAPGASTN